MFTIICLISLSTICGQYPFSPALNQIRPTLLKVPKQRTGCFHSCNYSRPQGPTDWRDLNHLSCYAGHYVAQAHLYWTRFGFHFGMCSCLTPVHFSSEILTDAKTVGVIAVNGCKAIMAGFLSDYLRSALFCFAAILSFPINA